MNTHFKIILVISLVFLLGVQNAFATDKVYSLVLEGGRVIDPETGLNAIRNVAISKGEIVAISESPLLAKMTLYPAKRLEKFTPSFRKKGRSQLGADADITIFDPLAIKSNATYEHPFQGPNGIEFVIVNGSFIVKDGLLQENVFPGQRLKSRY